MLGKRKKESWEEGKRLEGKEKTYTGVLRERTLIGWSRGAGHLGIGSHPIS